MLSILPKNSRVSSSKGQSSRGGSEDLEPSQGSREVLTSLGRGFVRLLQSCWWREFGLRLFYFLIGVILGVVCLYVIKHTRGFDDHISQQQEILIPILTGAITLAFSEIRIAHIEFKFPHRHDFKLRRLITNFVKHHDRFFPEAKAKVALSLFLADPQENEVEINTSFVNYLKLLSAATISTQREWFATYRMPLDRWEEISKHSNHYFMTLQGSRVKKTRVVIRPQDEIDQINYGSDIVKETLMSSAQLHCIPEAHTSKVEDYALFDDELVIMALPFDQTGVATSDPYSVDLETEMRVRILKGADKVSQYIKTKRKLEENVCRVSFTKAGQREYTKKTKTV